MRFATLSDQQVEIVARNQRVQQRAWREAPPTGRLVECCGRDYLVLPEVFPPRRDSRLMIACMDGVSGAEVLDMGTGSGVLAVFAALRGAERVVAVDVNPRAVRNAALNAERQGVGYRIEPRLSDGFSRVSEGERFDLILANLPGRMGDAGDLAAAAQWDSGFRLHRSFFVAAPRHLRPGGRILMTKANYPELNQVVELAEDSGFGVGVLAEEPPEGDDPRTYYVLAFRL